jgi:hypothetical protein
MLRRPGEHLAAPLFLHVFFVEKSFANRLSALFWLAVLSFFACRFVGVVRFKVQYDEYGNQETVDAYAVRPRASSGSAAKTGGGALKKKKTGDKVVEQEDEVDGEEGPKIPESLKILPGDSDKVVFPRPPSLDLMHVFRSRRAKRNAFTQSNRNGA